MWVPPEQADPVVLHAPTRRSMALFGAVNVRTGQLVTMMIPLFDALSFQSFLELLLPYRRPGRRMRIVLDNARYHRARHLIDFFNQRRKRLQLDFLPPYSPQLNPIERAWKLLRRLRTHNQYFKELDDMIQAISTQLKIWHEPNETLARLCCII
jgi:transposase